MILVDVNLLLYARFSNFAQHEAAREWLDEKLDGHQRVGLAWPTLLSFVRLSSNPRVLEKPDSVRAAWKQAEDWLDCAPVWIPQPGEKHREVIGKLLSEHAARPNLVADAHLAALAMEHGLTLCSTDGDFARFPELTWMNPLAAWKVSEPAGPPLAKAARRASPRAR